MRAAILGNDVKEASMIAFALGCKPRDFQIVTPRLAHLLRFEGVVYVPKGFDLSVLGTGIGMKLSLSRSVGLVNIVEVDL